MCDLYKLLFNVLYGKFGERAESADNAPFVALPGGGRDGHDMVRGPCACGAWHDPDESDR